MLVTDAHSGAGGIAQYNRDVLAALASFDEIQEIVVVARNVSETVFAVPAKVRYDLQSIGSQAAFVRRSAAQAFGGGPFDLIYCAHINLMPVASVIAKARRIPLVLAIYGIDAWTPPTRRLAIRCAGACDLVVSISDITLDRFQAWAGVGRSTTAVLPNAIRAEEYGPGEKSPDLMDGLGIRNRKVIMTLGRMAPDERYKGFDEVIELLPRLRVIEPDILYLAAGDGADRPRLEAKARDLGVTDLVVFPGRIPEGRKADYYRLADAYVMPSYGEGFGFVVLEALSCGIPVIASTSDGTREAVKDGELGLVVDPKDSAALERAIVASLMRPKVVPLGLDYFSFVNFEKRLYSALSPFIAV